jgi:hypothetical protein
MEPHKDSPGAFIFKAAKRGRRIGWADDLGDPVEERCFRHSRTPGLILWEPADDVPTAPQKQSLSPARSKDAVFDLVPLDTPIEKKALISQAQAIGIGEKKAGGFIAVLVHEGKLFPHLTKRPRTNDLVSLARYKQGGVS